MDPMTFSIIRHRLFRVTDEGMITLKRVSGSAITNEGHDLMVGLYRADGGLLMGGLGFLTQMVYAAEACKVIIRRFSGNINKDDMFLINDPYTAAAHTSDIFLVAPIHYRGTLVAWSACFVHVSDIGALNPGGFSPESKDIYTEGFSSPGLKLISRGTLRQDIFDTFLNMVRSPQMVALDLRAMIACNNVARSRMVDLIDKYGADTIDDAGRLLISQSDELLRARIAELPKGRWQARQYMDVLGTTYKVCLALTNDGKKLSFDFAGTSPQSDKPINGTSSACLGAVMAPLFPLLCYDIVWNEGIIRNVQMEAPEGSVVSCKRPAPVSIATVGAIQSARIAASEAISKMLLASEKYCKDASGVWHANSFAIFLFGKNQHGQDAMGVTTESLGGAGGARTFADGVDVGGLITNPISRMANVESIESTFPVRYLFRRRRADSGGAGKYRGGTGVEMAITPHDSPERGFRYVVSGKGQKHAMTDGLAGGYPGARNRYVVVRDGQEGRENRPLLGAKSFSELDGTREDVSWGMHRLSDGEVLYIASNGGGGYSDPLERDPNAVVRDVHDRLVSRDCAQRVYGTVIDESGSYDAKATTELRRTMTAARGKGLLVA
jgi:N-methylhydantoinase B